MKTKIPQPTDSSPAVPSPAPSSAARRRLRSAIRIALAVTFTAGAYAAYHFSRPAPPETLREAAREARRDERWTEAEIHLRKLAQRTPLGADEQRALAESFLRQAQQRDPSATYATVSQAFEHLVLASEAAPGDRSLQQELLNASVARGEPTMTRIAAERVLETTPDDPDALLAHFAATLALDPAAVDDRLDVTFRLLVLARPRLAKASTVARDRLFRAAIRRAPDGTSAQARLSRLLDGYETLADDDDAPLAEIARDVSALLATASELAKANATPSPDSLRGWADADQRAERLRAAARAAGPCAADVYYQSAAAAFAQGETQSGLEILATGLTQAGDSPALEALAAPPAFAWLEESSSPEAPRNRQDLHRLAAYHLIELRRYSAAEPHLQALRDDADSAGSAALLAGWSALSQGKSEIARREFLLAREQLGDVAPPRMGLASVELLERNWRGASEHLRKLHEHLDRFSPEDRAWSARFFGEGRPGLTLCRLYAELKLGNWSEADRLAESLIGTPWEPRAEAVIIADSWSSSARPHALERLADARCRWPIDFGLMAVEWMILCQQDRPDEARGVVERFAASIPADDLETQLLLCGWRVRNRQADDAWSQLQSIRSNGDPASARSIALLQVETLLALGRVDEALQVAAPLRDDPRTAMIAGIFSAVAESRLDSPARAEQSLRDAARVKPESVLLNHLRGEFAMHARDWRRAWNHLSQSMDVFHLRAKAGRQLAFAVRELAKQESVDELQTQLAELLARIPDDPHLRVAQAELLLKLGRSDEATELLERVQRQGAGDRELTALVAEAWWQAGRTQQAWTTVARGLQTFAGDANCFVIAAKTNLALRRPDYTLDYAIAAQKADPRNVAAPLLRAEALHQLRRRFEAIVVLEQAARQFPESAEVHLALGRMFERSGRWEDAIKAYRQGQARTPQDVTLRRAEVAALLAVGRLADAQEVANRLAGERPSPDICLALGEAFDSARQYALSHEWFQRALVDADAKHVSAAHLLLGMSLTRQRRGDSGRVGPATAESDASDAETLVAIRDHFSIAWNADPHNLVAANNLAWTLAVDCGQPAEAACVLDQARGDASIAYWPTTFVHTCAVVYRAAGREEDARRALDESLRFRPEQAKLWLERGQLACDHDEVADAHGALQRALELGLSDVDSQRARSLLARLDPH